LYAKIRDVPKLLTVKTTSLGDVIHHLPIIIDIRVHDPDIDIHGLLDND
jgi:ADP-heptose:LPS heptosyltransferase